MGNFIEELFISRVQRPFYNFFCTRLIGSLVVEGSLACLEGHGFKSPGIAVVSLLVSEVWALTPTIPESYTGSAL